MNFCDKLFQFEINSNKEEETNESNDLIDEVMNLTISTCLGVIKLFEGSVEYSELKSLMYL